MILFLATLQLLLLLLVLPLLLLVVILLLILAVLLVTLVLLLLRLHCCNTNTSSRVMYSTLLGVRTDTAITRGPRPFAILPRSPPNRPSRGGGGSRSQPGVLVGMPAFRCPRHAYCCTPARSSWHPSAYGYARPCPARASYTADPHASSNSFSSLGVLVDTSADDRSDEVPFFSFSFFGTRQHSSDGSILSISAYSSLTMFWGIIRPFSFLCSSAPEYSRSSLYYTTSDSCRHRDARPSVSGTRSCILQPISVASPGSSIPLGG